MNLSLSTPKSLAQDISLLHTHQLYAKIQLLLYIYAYISLHIQPHKQHQCHSHFYITPHVYSVQLLLFYIRPLAKLFNVKLRIVGTRLCSSASSILRWSYVGGRTQFVPTHQILRFYKKSIDYLTIIAETKTLSATISFFTSAFFCVSKNLNHHTLAVFAP